MLELVKRYKIAFILGLAILINIILLTYNAQNHAPIELDLKQEEVKKELTNVTLEQQDETLSSMEVNPIDPIDKEVAQSAEEVEKVEEVISVPIYICGAVKYPGVYYVAPDAIINEVICLSGGFTEEADTTLVNLASPVVAHEKIVVPKQGEKIDKSLYSYDNSERMITSSQQDTGVSQKEGLININQASQNELMNLPGIGAVKAQAIITYRETVKPFSRIDDLKKVSGIGDKTFEKLKMLITV